MYTHKQPKEVMSAHHCSWILLSSNEHSWFLRHGAMNTNESSRAVMSMGPLSHGHLLSLMSTDGAIAPYSWMFKSAYERWWVLMNTHDRSWELMNDDVRYTILNKKCWFSKWSPCSIFQISRSRLYQMIINWIFLKSTQKGLLKNVQDGISRPLGSREIQKTKVGTILWDTLYLSYYY